MKIEETPCCALVFLAEVYDYTTAKEIKEYIKKDYEADCEFEDGKVINNPYTTIQCVALQNEKKLQKTLTSLGFKKKLSFYRRKIMNGAIGNKMCYLYTVNYTTLMKSKI